MPVIFHPPVEQIEANFFGRVTFSNRRILNILKNLGQDGEDYEVFYQPCIGAERPDFAVIRAGWGIQLIKTCELDLHKYIVLKDGNYQSKKNQKPVLSPFNSVINSKGKLCNDILAPFYFLENRDPSPDFLRDKQSELYECISTSVYFLKPLFDLCCLYQPTTFRLKYDSSPSLFEKHTYFWTMQDSDLLILCQIRKNFKKRSVFSDAMQDAIRCQFLSLDRISSMYAVPLQGKQASLAISSPGEKQRIRGAAGTGKTTVLAQRAINCFTMSHEPVLILYFNVTLGSYLKSKIFQQNHTLFSPFFPNDS